MTYSSHSAYTCDRRAQRFPLRRSDKPFVEFVLEDGSFWRLSLLEISVLGIGFRLDDESVSVSIGTKIDRATIRAGRSRVEGSLSIVHVTPGHAFGTVCGAKFVPSSEADDVALTDLVALLEKLGPRSD